MPTRQMSRSKGFRASKPKVRTGCSTCKARRIKCDETRPNCIRCARFGRKCAGYESDKPAEEPKRAPDPTERAIVPKSDIAGPSTLFDSEEEFNFFRHYCDETVANLAGPFELPVWSRVVLQASHHQAFIRHAIIAIGSISKSARSELTNVSQCPSPPDSAFSESTKSDDEKFFLNHYAKFLRGSRVALTGSHTQGRRMALIVCLLIICAEGHQWHHRSVLKHLTSGINLLDEWMTSHPKSPALPGISSPEPDVVEDEIVQQFRVLEFETSVLYDPKSLEYHERLKREGNETVNNMPDAFTSTQEARQFLELVMRRTHHFLGTVVPQTPSLSPGAADPDRQSLVASFDTFETFGGAVQPLQLEQGRYTAEIRRWTSAFQPLFTSRAPEDKDFLSTQLLKIRSRVLGILLAGGLSTSEMIYDNFLPEFEEILLLAKTFFGHPSAEKIIREGSYSSNAGLIFPLRLVADRSRSRSMRREAIGVLRSKAWREASFWSTSTAQISEWLMDIEEDGVETEDIPEWARARLVQVEFDEGREVRKVRVKAVRGVGSEQLAMEGSWRWGFAGARSASDSGTPRSAYSGSDVEGERMSFQRSPT